MHQQLSQVRMHDGIFFLELYLLSVKAVLFSDSLSYICRAVRPSAVLLGPDQTEQLCPKLSVPLTLLSF